MTTESSKQKITKIHDIFPAATKDQIAKILQYYEDDENKALDALTRDGGCEALSNLADSGSVKSKNNKNKKKKKKGKKESDLAGSVTASFDADDSSSLHSSGNVDAEVEKECSGAESRNGILHNSSEETKEISHERLNVLETDNASTAPKLPEASKSDGQCEKDAADVCVSEVSKSSSVEVENSTCISPVSDSSDKPEDQSSRKDKYRSINPESYGKHTSRQRTSSFRRSKTSSLSEDSMITNSQQNTAVPTKRGYEKCKKDLNRQTISLQRISLQVEKGLEDSEKKIKNSFNEIRKLLDKRQEEIEQDLAKSKEDALNLLKSRQDLALELKRRVDRASTLTETEWTELRSDVKQYVTERKYDDELRRTIWYQWSVDSITEIINSFGEVHPVKNVYSQRSHSALSNTAASQNNPEPSPSSSLANEEISSTADKNDVANILDAVEDELPSVKKDIPTPTTRTHPTESRSRVFSNTKFQNSRGNRGGFKGPRGGGYGYYRPNNRNNMGNRNNYSYDYNNDYRNYSHQERDGRVHDSSAFPNDRNMNRNNRRGQNNPYRSGGRFRGNMGQHRQNNENVTKPESASNETPAVDTANVVNGYVNN